MRLEFFMLMVPPTITAQEHKVAVVKGRPHFYDPPELKAAKNKLRAHLGKYAPTHSLIGPVRLVTKWCWPTQGTTYADGDYKITNPDTDNLMKMLKDVMESLGFFINDAQVASEITEKFWADVPGIYVCVEEIDA